jgi:uncharacterized lipoprotein NlpE involved in copper resistance
MKTKHGFLFGFAVITMAAIFTLTGCPTEDNGGNGGDSQDTGELWEKFTTATTAETATAWKKDGSDITLTFYFEEKKEDRGYAKLKYTTTVTTDSGSSLYVKLNSASSWYGKFGSSVNVSFEGDEAGTVTFPSATSMTIAGIPAEESEAMYNGTYTKQ